MTLDHRKSYKFKGSLGMHEARTSQQVKLRRLEEYSRKSSIDPSVFSTKSITIFRHSSCYGKSSSVTTQLPNQTRPFQYHIKMMNLKSEAQNPELPKECAGCGKKITDRFLLKALDMYWHEDCLKCGCCDCRLGEVGSTLYTKANLILCKRDYLRLFGSTGYCAACSKVIPAFEMVMRARNNVYHLECFACQQCNHRFCVGDRFYLCDNRILCEYDYEERMVFANMSSTGNGGSNGPVHSLKQQRSGPHLATTTSNSTLVDSRSLPGLHVNGGLPDVRSSHQTVRSADSTNINQPPGEYPSACSSPFY
ncbi:unnamed protein product [Allacma fusca]|uniref:LIM zinc-binding domain-containing protein n=1 Tax=Allacma fusca TaxID=39272 RepID=A0A8J2PJA7_9HEXA|nr:unnamed protein product [Allacma fusca]